MKAIHQVTMNMVGHRDPDGGLAACPEVTLLLVEPAYIFAAGAMTKTREVEVVRFAADAAQLRHLAKVLEGYAAEAEAWEASATGKEATA